MKTALVLVVVGIAALSEVGLAAPEAKIVVLFEPAGELVAAPQARGDKLVLFYEADSDTISPGATVAHIDHIYRFGMPGYSLNGPWIIRYRDSIASTIISSLTSSGLVEYAVEYPEDSQEVISIGGDHSRAAFPDGEINDVFCSAHGTGWTYSSPWHLRRNSEQSFEDDPCEDTSSDLMDHDLDAPQAWKIANSITADTARVAVIDLGIDWKHADIGGPFPLGWNGGTSVDSMQVLSDGVLFRNYGECPGDCNEDGYPGVHNSDDDGDGLIDEDSRGMEPDNSTEANVYSGSLSNSTSTSLTDSSADWTHNQLQGLYVYGNMATHNCVYAEIDSNTSTVIFASGNIGYAGGWVAIASSGSPYLVGDLADNDADGWFDDQGYSADRNDDDDENGFADDLRGWDFIDISPPGGGALPNEDYSGWDNDPRSRAEHGTAVASQVASSWEDGRMASVGGSVVQIVPIRVGYATASSSENVNLQAILNGVSYAQMMGVNAIGYAIVANLSNPAFLSIAQQAIVDGDIVWAGGSYNGGCGSYYNTDAYSSFTEDVLKVVGVDASDALWHWCYGDYPSGSSWGSWADVCVRAAPLWAAIPTTSSNFNTARAGWKGNSLGAPTVAGIAGLIHHVYPTWTGQEIRDKIRSSVDDIYDPPESPGLNDDLEAVQGLGTGRVNAYKAITLYGSVGTIDADTSWSGTVWVSGDITIPTGATLTIEPGTTVNFARDDVTVSGTDTTNVEFHVHGSLVIGDDTGSAVSLVLMFSGEESGLTWGPIVLEEDAQLAAENVTFNDIADVVVVDEGRLSGGISIRLQDCEFQDINNGLIAPELFGSDVIEVTGCDFQGVDDGVGMLMNCVSGTLGVELSDCAFAGFDEGLNLEGHVGVTLDGDNSIVDCSGSGIRADSATSTIATTGLGSLMIDHCSAAGCYAVGSSTVSLTGILITRCPNAVSAVGGSSVTIRDCTISGSTIAMITDRNSQLDAGTIANPGHNVIYSSTSFHVVNGNSTSTLYAQKNCWDSSETPPSNKFVGVGPIVYLPGECQ